MIPLARLYYLYKLTNKIYNLLLIYLSTHFLRLLIHVHVSVRMLVSYLA